MQKKSSRTDLSRGARASGIVATVIALVIAVVTVLVLTPSGTPLRSEVRSVALPYFGQTWRVFAPGILKSNRTLEIRAQWRDENGDLVKSGWVPITELEQRTVTGNTAPSRIQKATWNATAELIKRYNALDEEQRERVRDTFIEVEGDGFQPIPVEQLIEEIGTDDPDVIRYLRLDYMLMRLSTLYATAGFGRDIERVQWRTVGERPNDFTHRFDDEAQFETAVTTYGWRQSDVAIDAQVVETYRGIIERYHGADWFEEAADVAE
ncbi:DUF5819 family protein [Microbacterium sp. CIAB417]|uniref:DUF5819 family protein n=1 Tax=Microbacterium sp. CIAB417 TaxID=2860287 RepID=UPI001FAC988B|nr:DUF5819 family protein [Microbacterium sp. CIAB417]